MPTDLYAGSSMRVISVLNASYEELDRDEDPQGAYGHESIPDDCLVPPRLVIDPIVALQKHPVPEIADDECSSEPGSFSMADIGGVPLLNYELDDSEGNIDSSRRQHKEEVSSDEFTGVLVLLVDPQYAVIEDLVVDVKYSKATKESGSLPFAAVLVVPVLDYQLKWFVDDVGSE